MPSRPSVIIPVHNGGGALPATLDALASQADAIDSVIVVLNGCVDNSAEAAEAGLISIAGRGVETKLLHMAEGSRAAALNAGEAGATTDRIYLDQDAVLSPGAIVSIADAFATGAKFVTGRAGWRSPSRAVLAAMDAWNALPYVRRSPVSAGMYAITAEGRTRWDRWEHGLPDDKFARLQFEADERRRLEDVEYTVDAPYDLRGLITARRRYAVSNTAIRRRHPELLARDLPRGAVNLIGMPPRLWFGTGLLVGAEIIAQLGSGP